MGVMYGRSISRFHRFVLCAVAPLLLGVASQSAAQPAEVTTSLGDLSSYYDSSGPMNLSTTPDGLRLAYKHEATIISGIRTSRGGQESMESVSKTVKWRVVINGRGFPYFDEISHGPVFNRDGTRLAYAARVGRQWRVVVDDVQGKSFTSIGTQGLIFSPDGRKLAYAAEGKGSWSVIIDGAVGKRYSEIGDIAFSPDSRLLAYAARGSGGWAAVVDGAEGKPYDQVFGISFSPDSKHLAYAAKRGAKTFVVCDGVESEEFDSVEEPIAHSADGSTLAYRAERNGMWRVVTGKNEGQGYDDIGPSVPSPTGSSFAYWVKKGQDRMAVVADGVEGAEYLGVMNPVFSPDGKRLAYAAGTGKKRLVVVDGVAGKEYDGVIDPIFSPDGKHVAYQALSSDKESVVVDGIEGNPYGHIQCLSFSPDGSRIAYLVSAEPDSELMSLVVNDLKGMEYVGKPCSVIRKTPMSFTGPDKLHFFTFTKSPDWTAYRNDVSIPAFIADYGRVIAIQKETDRGLLVQAALLDDDPRVRRAAELKLGIDPKDNKFLLEVVESHQNADVQKAAVGRMTDQKLLEKVVTEHRDPSIQKAAVAGMTDQNLLEKIVTEHSDPDVQKAAVGRMTDQKLLEKIVTEHRDTSVRQSAVEKVADQTLLKKLAWEDKDPSVRQAAVKRITDQELLEEIATKHADSSARCAAVRKLYGYQKLVIKVSLEDSDSSVRRVAAGMLTDRKVLAKIALEDKDASVRCAAVVRLTDKKLLSQIVAIDTDSSVRRAAVGRLTDQKLLSQIVATDTDLSVRQAAIWRLTDKALLARLLQDSSDSIIRDAARKMWNPKDGAEMVWIPAGEFVMGSDSGYSDRKPAHKVYLDAYWIYKHEVTIGQYEAFCKATGRSLPSRPAWGWIDKDYPVVNVSWDDANAYAQWAGCSLPTEAQWEKAARGTDGKLYPWGDQWPPPAGVANISDETAKFSGSDRQFLQGYDDGYANTSPAGSFVAGASPYGVLDMAGNVWEWCADWYANDYYKNAPARNPAGPEDGSARVLRGSSWPSDIDYYFQCASRFYHDPTLRYINCGFRCARTP